MAKRYKTCLFCKNKFIADRQIKVCDQCLGIVGVEKEIIKYIQKSENIEYITEEKVTEEMKSAIKEFIKSESR